MQPHGLQHTMLLCPPLSPRVCLNSCPLSQSCYLTISSPGAPFSFCPQPFPAFGSVLMSWLLERSWSFSFSNSPSNDYSRLISFRVDFIDLCSPRDTQESSPARQYESIISLVISLLYDPMHTFIQDYWKNHSFGYTLSAK